MRWACILLPQLAMDGVLRQRADADAPLALLAGPPQRRRIQAVNEAARALGLKPMARWLGSAVAGVDPGFMGYGPVPATKKLLKHLGLTLDQVGLVELNEAFAAQSLGVMRRLGLRHEITNVNGGAIALGHPVGCSGARILTTLLHEIKRRAPSEKRPYYGLATLCVGVGMGVSTLVEWLDD